MFRQIFIHTIENGLHRFFISIIIIVIIIDVIVTVRFNGTSGLRGKGVTQTGVTRVMDRRGWVPYIYIVQIYSFECFLKILKLRFLSFGT